MEDGMDDLRFAKIVVDGFGDKHILVGGEIITIQGPKSSEWTEAIVTALRGQAPEFKIVHGKDIGLAETMKDIFGSVNP